nr:WD40 repeat domain-containing protein [Anaerolineae bacterium]
MTDYKPLYEDSYALIIGIDSYASRKFVPLGEAENDARAMARLLAASPYNFQVIKLLGAQATKAAILEALFNLQNTRPDDRILVYFAGHGYTLSDRFGADTGYLACHDTQPEKHYTALELSEVTDLRRRAAAKHIAFIFDACFSGQALGLTRSATDVAAEKFLTRRAYQVISAGAGDQTVSDFHSMTDLLIEKLCDEQVDTINGLGLYVQLQMAADSGQLQIPQFGHLSGSQGGDFIFEADPDIGRIRLPARPSSVPSLEPAPAQPTSRVVRALTSRWLNLPVWAWAGGALAAVAAVIIAVTSGGGEITSTPTPTETAAATVTGTRMPGDDDMTATALAELDPLEQFATVWPQLMAGDTADSWIRRLDWAADNIQLAAVLGNQTAARWQIGQTSPLEEYEGARIGDVDWSSRGLLALSYIDDSQFAVWDPNRGMLGPYEVEGIVTDIEYSPDGSRLATIAVRATGTILLWNTSGIIHGQLDRPEMGVNPNYYTLSFSPDGARIAGGSSGMGSGAAERVNIWQVSDGSLMLSIEVDNSYGMITQTAWSPDGSAMAALVHDPDDTSGTVQVFSATTGELIAVLADVRTAPDKVTGIAWSPDSSLLAVAAGSSGVYIWSIEDARLRPLTGPGSYVFCVAWSGEYSGNRSQLAAGYGDNDIFLWEWDRP